MVGVTPAWGTVWKSLCTKKAENHASALLTSILCFQRATEAFPDGSRQPHGIQVLFPVFQAVPCTAYRPVCCILNFPRVSGSTTLQKMLSPHWLSVVPVIPHPIPSWEIKLHLQEMWEEPCSLKTQSLFKIMKSGASVCWIRVWGFGVLARQRCVFSE
jgi:hypothetical protein